MINDLRYGIRMLAKSPGFTLVAVVALGLGIGANTALFSVINGVLLRPLPYPGPDRLVMLWESNSRLGFHRDLVTGRSFTEWRDQNRVFEQMAFWPSWFGTGYFTVVGREGRERVGGEFVSASLFPLLGAKPILGRTFLPEEDQEGSNRVVVLSHGVWQRRFGADRNVLGQTLTIDGAIGRFDWTVIGVMPQGFQFPGKAELWLPVGWMGVGLTREFEGMAHWFNVIARLKPGVGLEQARVEINTLQRRIAQQHPNARIGSEVEIVPLLEQIVGGIQPVLLVLTGAVVIVLLIACSNVANLLLARATTRQKEIAIRRAVGATRLRIIHQLLSESLLLFLLGGALGTLLSG